MEQTSDAALWRMTKVMLTFMPIVFCLWMTCFCLMMSGRASLSVEGFAVDSNDLLYVGLNEKICVYDGDALVRTIDINKSKGYLFTIDSEDRIILSRSPSQDLYIYDLEGNEIGRQEESEQYNYNDLQWRKRKFTSQSGDKYRLVGNIGWPRITKNGETIYRLDLVSVCAKGALVVGVIAFLANFVFLIRAKYQPDEDSNAKKKESI